jgi:Tol biopolymer transport system component
LSVIPSGGGSEINLMNTLDYAGVAWTPSWSPDGKKLVFGFLHDVYLVNSDGTGLKMITTNQQGGSAMWSPK